MDVTSGPRLGPGAWTLGRVFGRLLTTKWLRPAKPGCGPQSAPCLERSIMLTMSDAKSKVTGTVN